jgi:hypothetical protein
VAVWRAIEECPFFEAVAIALGEVIGKETEVAYRGGPWGLPDGDELARLFDAAGVSDARVTRRALPVVFEGGPSQLVATLVAASVAPEVAALGEQGRADLVAATATALGPLLHDDGAVYSEAASHVVRATR